MLESFKSQVFQDFPEIENKCLYLAISGGKDSMTLSHLLKSIGLNHTLLHCNFKLRGKESDDDQKFLLQYADEHGLSIKVKSFETFDISQKMGKSIQEIARDLRYDWFASQNTDGNTLILTAHHLDDSIETFMINLLRGTGLKGVKGIPRFNPPYYRPLLKFTSEELTNYVNNHNISFREDSSNADSKYLRNYIRNSILPEFLNIGSKFQKKMSSFFNEMELLDDYISKKALEFKAEHFQVSKQGICAKVDKVKSAHYILLLNSLREFGIKRSNLESFINFLDGTVGASFITSSHTFHLDRENLFVLEKGSSFEPFKIFVDSLPSVINTTQNKLEFSLVDINAQQLSKNPIQLDYNKIKLPLIVRNWNTGDKIYPLGMTGRKLISDVLIDNKIPQHEKAHVLLVADSNNVVICLPGILVSEKVKIDKNTIDVLQVFSTPI
jgi:tRNA(Ile)-lysidine synthase